MERGIGKLPVDGWCQETRLLVRGWRGERRKHELSDQLLDETRKNTAYLRHFVTIVEMWECQLKVMTKDPVVQRCLHAMFPRLHAKRKLTRQQILTEVRACTLFGRVECDVRVSEELRARFAEIQHMNINDNLTRDNI